MDWSKKIGLSILLVLVLVACSSRKNYGSVYLASGDDFIFTEMVYNLSASEYMTYSDSIISNMKSLSRYEDEFFNSIDSLSLEGTNLKGSLMNTKDSLLTKSLKPNKTLYNDTSYIDTIKMVRSDSSSVVVDELIEDSNVEDFLILDSLNYNKIDSTAIEDKVKKVSDTTKIIYTDTIGLIREKELQNTGDSKDIELRYNDNKSPKTNAIIILNGQKEKSDSLKSKKAASSIIVEDSTELDVIEDMGIDNIKATEDSIQEVLNKAKSLEESERLAKEKSKADSIAKSNVLYLKELDSIKTVNESLRTKSKTKDSAVDTLIYSVFFESGQKVLSEANKQTLLTLVKDAKEKNYAIQLAGYADKSGSASFNKILSEHRVKNVLSYLVSKGLDDRKIHFQSFGEKYSPNSDDLNRRIVYCKLILIND